MTRALISMLVLTVASPAPASADDVTDLFRSSFAHEKTGDTSRALNDVLQVLRKAPGHYVANLRAGWLYYQKGRYGDAVGFYTKAAALAPKALEPQLGMMLPLMAAGRWADAEAVGERVLKRAPRDYLAASRLAWVYFQQGRYKEAEARYLQVLEDFPSDTDMALGLAWTYVRQGRPTDARRHFEAVLTIHPDNLNARSGLDTL